jgi:hypothetical protein
MELAKKQCEKYYRFIQARQIDSTLQLFGVQPDIKSHNQLVADLDANRQSLGNISTVNRYTTKITTEIKDGKKSKQIAIVYKVQYDSSYLSKEVFYFHGGATFTGIIDSISCEGWEDSEKKE